MIGYASFLLYVFLITQQLHSPDNKHKYMKLRSSTPLT